MKLQQFLDVPTPKGGVKIPSNEIIANYKKLYQERRRNITSKLYTIDRKVIYALVSIPSGNVKGFNYDVIIEFHKIGKTLEDSDIRIFSNSPSFVYRYAYVFYNMPDEGSSGMIIDKFSKHIPTKNLTAEITADKIPQEALHGPPITRNPYGIPLLDTTIYQAIFHILDRYNTSTITRARMVNERFFINNVKSFEKTMLLREKMLILEKKKVIEDKVPVSKIREHLVSELNDGKNVNVRVIKKGGNKVSVKDSTNVTKLKAAKTSMTVIKKMK